MDAASEARATGEHYLHAMVRHGISKAQVRIVETERHELNAEVGRLNLMRTTHDLRVVLVGIIDGKRGTVVLNKRDEDALKDAVQELCSVAAGSAPDAANDIAAAQPAQRFSRGPEAPDHDHMAHRMGETLEHARNRYPTVVIRQGFVDFVRKHDVLLNSNGVDYETRVGRYGATLMFGAREGTQQSSFNYTGFVRESLDRPLHECATTERLLRQSTEQVRTRKVPRKFTGALVITPDCLDSFLGFLFQGVSDVPLISGTSAYQDRLGEPVMSTSVSITSRPRELAGGYFVTDDGFEAHDAPLVEKGVLRSYLLSLYGANKTGMPRADTGGCWVVDPGAATLDELIGGVEEGLLITRFSGGRPNDKGDFSGIAKNSYYIRDGALEFPVSETMVSGNLERLLNDIDAVSKERADFGHRVYPWVRAGGVGMS